MCMAYTIVEVSLSIGGSFTDCASLASFFFGMDMMDIIQGIVKCGL